MAEYYDREREKLFERGKERFTSIIEKYTCLAHGLPSPEFASRRGRVSIRKQNSQDDVSISIASPCVFDDDNDLHKEVEETLLSRKLALGLPSELLVNEMDFGEEDEIGDNSIIRRKSLRDKNGKQFLSKSLSVSNLNPKRRISLRLKKVIRTQGKNGSKSKFTKFANLTGSQTVSRAYKRRGSKRNATVHSSPATKLGRKSEFTRKNNKKNRTGTLKPGTPNNKDLVTKARKTSKSKQLSRYFSDIAEFGVINYEPHIILTGDLDIIAFDSFNFLKKYLEICDLPTKIICASRLVSKNEMSPVKDVESSHTCSGISDGTSNFGVKITSTVKPKKVHENKSQSSVVPEKKKDVVSIISEKNTNRKSSKTCEMKDQISHIICDETHKPSSTDTHKRIITFTKTNNNHENDNENVCESIGLQNQKNIACNTINEKMAHKETAEMNKDKENQISLVEKGKYELNANDETEKKRRNTCRKRARNQCDKRVTHTTFDVIDKPSSTDKPKRNNTLAKMKNKYENNSESVCGSIGILKENRIASHTIEEKTSQKEPAEMNEGKKKQISSVENGKSEHGTHDETGLRNAGVIRVRNECEKEVRTSYTTCYETDKSSSSDKPKNNTTLAKTRNKHENTSENACGSIDMPNQNESVNNSIDGKTIQREPAEMSEGKKNQISPVEKGKSEHNANDKTGKRNTLLVKAKNGCDVTRDMRRMQFTSDIDEKINGGKKRVSMGSENGKIEEDYLFSDSAKCISDVSTNVATSNELRTESEHDSDSSSLNLIDVNDSEVPTLGSQLSLHRIYELKRKRGKMQGLQQSSVWNSDLLEPTIVGISQTQSKVKSFWDLSDDEEEGGLPYKMSKTCPGVIESPTKISKLCGSPSRRKTKSPFFFPRKRDTDRVNKIYKSHRRLTETIC